jgi:hypothetical protein
VNNIKKWNIAYLKWIKHGNEKLSCKVRKTINDDIIKATLSWLPKIRALNALILGTMIQEAPLWFADEFEVQNFQASSGWLGSFNKRSLISQRNYFRLKRNIHF